MRLAISVMLIAAAIACMGSTYAYFLDGQSSGNNTFSTGTLSLLLGNGASPASYTAGVSSSFGGSNLMPGAAIGPSTIIVKNAGTLSADHIDIKFQNAITNNPSYKAADLGADIADMSSVMVVTTLTLGAINLLTHADVLAADAASNHDGIITLNELNNVIVQSLTAPASGDGTLAFVIALSIPSSTGNGIQGDSVTTTVTFGLFQTSSQHLI